MAIFQRSLLREFGNLAVAVFATLFAITLTTQLIRYLGQAASGKLLSEAVLALLGFSALNYLPVLLSLTLFISVLMTISRSYRDSEMVIWFSAGLPLTAWVRRRGKNDAADAAAIAEAVTRPHDALCPRQRRTPADHPVPAPYAARLR